MRTDTTAGPEASNHGSKNDGLHCWRPLGGVRILELLDRLFRDETIASHELTHDTQILVDDARGACGALAEVADERVRDALRLGECSSRTKRW